MLGHGERKLSSMPQITHANCVFPQLRKDGVCERKDEVHLRKDGVRERKDVLGERKDSPHL